MLNTGGLHAVSCYNRGRTSGLADGIVITLSAQLDKAVATNTTLPTAARLDTHITKWIEAKANELLANKLAGVKRISYEQALKASTTHRHDYTDTYAADLINVIDLMPSVTPNCVWV